MPIPNNQDNPYVNAFWKWFPDMYSQLKQFRITGGEPLLNKNTFKVLDYIIENPNPNLTFSVNTNMNVPDELYNKFIEKLKIIQEGNLYGQNSRWGIYGKDGISPAITASSGMGGGHIPMIEIKQNQIEFSTHLIYNQGKTIGQKVDKSHSLMSRDYKGFGNQGMTGIVHQKRKVHQLSNNNKSNGGTQPYQQDRIYDINGISPALQSQLCTGSSFINTPSIRRLTPIECERLQTVPDNYTNHVSDSQRYKMIGNGWTVDVVAYILNYYKKEFYGE
jgi:hypothetical protein